MTNWHSISFHKCFVDLEHGVMRTYNDVTLAILALCKCDGHQMNSDLLGLAIIS